MGALTIKLADLPDIPLWKSKLLADNLRIVTLHDLWSYYPYRYDDLAQVTTIGSINNEEIAALFHGRLGPFKIHKGKGRALLKSFLQDDTGQIKLVWFNQIERIKELWKPGRLYKVIGTPRRYQGEWVITHPEISTHFVNYKGLRPHYHMGLSWEKMKMNSRELASLQQNLLDRYRDLAVEYIPHDLLDQYRLISRWVALKEIHHPSNHEGLREAKRRLKFEELFLFQLRMLYQKHGRKRQKSNICRSLQLYNQFLCEGIPFSLTDAQRRAMKKIIEKLGSGIQMQVLLQGDVGSGKTIIAFLSALITISAGLQVTFMAPTTVLAEQHYQKMLHYGKKIGLQVGLLTSEIGNKERKVLLEKIKSGKLQLIIGTHALLQDKVHFSELGLVIIDEQHRFGVLQRARLLELSDTAPPHLLVMSATPIPRTLALTLYGNLSPILLDELPAGRGGIRTIHRTDAARSALFGFLHKVVARGEQIYIVYPLIEEGKGKYAGYKDLMDGHKSISRSFPGVPLSILHGKMTADQKKYEMEQFAKGHTQIMVATTVIEVGVDVPNATVMVIEHAERFGLAQLHQLRGRVGRGKAQSYCILMTEKDLKGAAATRIATMVRSNDGFEIASIDMQLRGQGDITGIAQSGHTLLKLVDLTTDEAIVIEATRAVRKILEKDPCLKDGAHLMLKDYLDKDPTFTSTYRS